MTEKEKYVLEHYEITINGDVYSKLTRRNKSKLKRKKLSQREDKGGYFDVGLVYNDNGGRMPFRVHRLVLLKHGDEIEGCPVVNHKDCDKKNNKLDNLEWTTIALNTQHGYENNTNKKIRKIKVTEIDGTWFVFPSARHAARFYNYKCSSGISKMLRINNKSTISNGDRKGIIFEYTDDDVTTIR